MKITEFVPQVFYDVIARLASGSVLFLCIIIFWVEECAVLRNFIISGFKNAPTLFTLLMIVVVYLVAFVFEGVKKQVPFLNRLFSVPEEEAPKVLWEKTCNKISALYPEHDINSYEKPSSAIAIDVLRIVHPSVGARIVKLMAEEAMCRTLTSGILVLVFFRAAHLALSAYLNDMPLANLSINVFSVECCAPLLFLVCALMLNKRQKTLKIRRYKALYNHWILLVKPGVLDLTRMNQKGADPE